MIDLETVKQPVAKKDNRPSLWGLNVAREAQESASHSAIPKAILRRKLDHYYDMQIAEQNRILKAKARAKAAALLASKSRSSMMKPMGSQHLSSTSQPRFKQTQVIPSLRRSHQSNEASEQSRSPPRQKLGHGLTVDLPAQKHVYGQTMPKRAPTVLLQPESGTLRQRTIFQPKQLSGTAHPKLGRDHYKSEQRFGMTSAHGLITEHSRTNDYSVHDFEDIINERSRRDDSPASLRRQDSNESSYLQFAGPRCTTSEGGPRGGALAAQYNSQLFLESIQNAQQKVRGPLNAISNLAIVKTATQIRETLTNASTEWKSKLTTTTGP